MFTTFVANVQMETTECYKCGITFGYPKDYGNKLRSTHENFYCPNGHGQFFPSKSEKEILKDDLMRMEKRLEAEQQCCIKAREETNHIERRLWGLKGYVTRMKQRKEG